MYNNNTLSGKFTPRNPSKYRGNPTTIFFRSSWELRIMKWLDLNPSVLEWSSEEIAIPYISPVDGRPHRYFPDFWMRARSKSGDIKTMMLEIKPRKFSVPPQKPSRITRKYKRELVNYKINEAKWHAAQDYCMKQGVEFRVITESELGIT